jgi:hypothetical protein
MGGLGRPVAPVVGSPALPVMPHLVMLWKMSPLRGGVRAGARLWARGPARRGWVAIGPEPKPRGAGGAPGPLRGEGRRPAQGYWSCCKALGAPGSAGQTGKLAEQDILISAITARGFGSSGTKNEKSRGAAEQDQRHHRLNSFYPRTGGKFVGCNHANYVLMLHACCARGGSATTSHHVHGDR